MRHEQDAEDCFQDTFLALARKAGSIGRRQAVAGWLHRVAYRTALRSRTQAVRREARRRPLAEYPARESSEDLAARDLRPVLDDEVNRLPGKYRLPVVLCYLAGKTTEEAARQLGCPRGTVLSRLAWARDRLRTRLADRGLVVPLPAPDSAAILPARLIVSTVTAARWFTAGKAGVAGVASGSAFSLTEGVLRVMSLTQTKVITAVLGTALVGAGVGLWNSRPATAEAPDRTAASPDRAVVAEANPLALLRVEEPPAGKLKDELPQDRAAQDNKAPDAKPAQEPAVRFVNSQRIRLDYEIKGAGSSEVSALELWVTTDAGRTWQYYQDFPRPVRPLIVKVPGEGTYGFTLLVRRKDGPGPRQPRAGDRPQIVVEVDLTRPRLVLFRPEVGRGKQAGVITVRWEATGKHLGSRPISLFYAARSGGPWVTIAADLRNTGHYAWRMPASLPRGFWLRLEAHDLAGNVATAQAQVTGALDGNEPEAVIRGAEPADTAPPREHLEGKVEHVVGMGLITLSVGRDDGVEKGEILEVYRLKPEPRYLGKVRIIEVGATRAYAQPVSSLTGAHIREGDRVARDIQKE